MKNPYAGHKILCYEVRLKQNPKDVWHFMLRSKTRKGAERFITSAALRGTYLLSRIRLIDGLNHKEDLRESAKS